MLFKNPVNMPSKDQMTAVMKKHIGSIECFGYDEKVASFGLLEKTVEFQDGKFPVQLMIMGCNSFEGEGIDDFIMSQMWDCQEEKERIFEECQFMVVATDMVAASLNPLERANLDANFVDALAELYPTCEAFYFPNCGKLFLAKDVKTHQSKGAERFMRFGVNVRFFNIHGTNDMLIDTVGMNTLSLTDLQYHFHDIDPNIIVNHAYSLVLYILESGKEIQNNDKIFCSIDDDGTKDIQCKCR